MEPIFFASQADFRRWLEENHASADELLVGFHKKGTSIPSIDWPQARDQALCYGWIDGVRKSLGPQSYTIRFTPRRPGSIWSRVNIDRFNALKAEGLVTRAGQKAFDEGKARTDHYSYENDPRELEPAEQASFETHAAAWTYFQARSRSYRKMALFWVTCARKPETRARRLAALIAASAEGQPIGVIGKPRGAG